jgi:hypothetical protein
MDESSTLPRPVVRCLTKEEAAEYLSIGITLLASMDIPTIRFGRRLLYDRVDLDQWLEEYKQRGRAGKESKWPVLPESTGADDRAFGGLQQRCPTANAYAKALGLKTGTKPKPCLPKSS